VILKYGIGGFLPDFSYLRNDLGCVTDTLKEPYEEVRRVAYGSQALG